MITKNYGQADEFASRQQAGAVAARASSMMRRMVRAHRPHCALQPRQ
jgi:hypothetical protein